jgi:Leucine-rich repeat (LRR) protein
MRMQAGGKVFSSAVFCLLASATLAMAAATERDVADWVIRQGGRVVLEGSRTPLRDLSDLPTGELHITGVDLTNTLIEPPKLEKLSGLTGLRELYLPASMWTPFSDSPLDDNDDLKYLAGLKNLERLYFSLHFLPTYNVADKGLAHLTGLTNIKELRLAQSQVVKPDLTKFVHLESLDLSDSTFTDEGMKGLEGLKELRRLDLRNTAVTDEGIKHLSGLTELEELDLYGVKVTDSGLASLRNLSAMRKLNLLGAEIDDAGMEVFAGMVHLREVNLYRTHVTNAGLAKLRALTELVALDVRYSRVTAAGVEALHAAVPGCAVEFVGSAAGTASAAAIRPSGTSEKAIAEWIKALGGKAEFKDGKLRAVSLVSTSISDAQLEYLSGLGNLETLNLQATETGDLGLSALKSLTGLKQLVLRQWLGKLERPVEPSNAAAGWYVGARPRVGTLESFDRTYRTGPHQFSCYR